MNEGYYIMHWTELCSEVVEATGRFPTITYEEFKGFLQDMDNYGFDFVKNELTIRIEHVNIES